MLYTSEGVINIKNAKWQKDFSPIDPNSTTEFSTKYTKAYLRHLFKVNELFGMTIASIHNLRFYLWLVETSREKILAGEFREWKDAMVAKVQQRL
jgi:queuine tRNA-ribosyltransferase